MISKGKEIIKIDSRDELGFLPDMLKRSVINPQILLENVISSSSIKDNPKKMTPTTSSLPNESRSNKENIEEELSFSQNISVWEEMDINKENDSL